jgi:hypothetical protein
MVSSGTLNIVFVKLDKSFLFIDDCGMEWIIVLSILYSAFLTASAVIFIVTGC